MYTGRNMKVYPLNSLVFHLHTNTMFFVFWSAFFQQHLSIFLARIFLSLQFSWILTTAFLHLPYLSWVIYWFLWMNGVGLINGTFVRESQLNNRSFVPPSHTGLHPTLDISQSSVLISQLAWNEVEKHSYPRLFWSNRMSAWVALMPMTSSTASSWY